MGTLLPLILMGVIQIATSRLAPVAPPNVFQPNATTTCTLEPIDPQMEWDQAIVSWNVKEPVGAHLHVEARTVYDDHTTKWYVLGDWSVDSGSGTRQSTDHQKDDDGTVYTDTLDMKRRGGRLQLRVTGSGGGNLTRLSLLTVSFCDTSGLLQKPEPDKRAWGKVIEMPFRRQGAYPNGGVLCSPTSVSMDLWHWSNVLHRPELDADVPIVQQAVYDPVYKGTGNWPFNTAYFGSKPGLMGYVSRFSSIRELEQWIQMDIPVICSVSFQLLTGRELDRKTESGHLVVLVGFTPDGDPVFNDPAQHQAPHIYPRKDFEAAWAYSHQTVYLCYPMEHPVPRNDGQNWIYP